MKNILIIQTGGTIAMSAKGDGVELQPDAWSNALIEKGSSVSRTCSNTYYSSFF